MNNIPNKIYLQIGLEGEPCEDFKELLKGEVSWCSHKVNDDDIEYSLSPVSDAVEFAEWLAAQEWLQLCDGEWYHEDDKDGDQPIKEDRLYTTFLKEKITKVVKNHMELHDKISKNQSL